jgi:ATP-binding cassette subfamily C protein
MPAAASSPSSSTPVERPTRLAGTLLRGLVERVPRAAATAFLVNLGVGGVDAAALVLLVELMRQLGLGGPSGAPARIAGALDAWLGTFGLSLTLPIILSAYAATAALLAWLSKRQTMATFRLEHEFAASLRRDLYHAVMTTRWDVFCRRRSSDFSHVMTLETDRSAAVAGQLLSLCAVGVSTLAYGAMAIRVSPGMTALVSTCAVAVLLSLRPSGRLAHASGETLSTATSHLYSAIADDVASLKTARSYGAEGRHATRFQQLSDAVQSAYGQLATAHADVKFHFDLGGVLMLAAVVYIGALRLTLPSSDLFLLLFLFARLMPKVASLRSGYQVVASHLPSFAAVTSVLKTCRAAAEPKAARVEPLTFEREIRLEHVSFGYDRVPAVRDISIAIRAGERTALIGPSGSGKSTIADLVMGLVAPDQGRIVVDDVCLDAERLESWRTQVGYVAQDAFLFHDTVRANLLWARPTATDAELVDCLHLSAADFVLQWPDGLDTIVGDRGVLVSGGERQRLALARALVRHPSVLILDEATSALDADNERRILDAVDQLPWSPTVLLITHRRSAIAGAHVVHSLDNGCLIATTTRHAGPDSRDVQELVAR